MLTSKLKDVSNLREIGKLLTRYAKDNKKPPSLRNLQPQRRLCGPRIRLQIRRLVPCNHREWVGRGPRVFVFPLLQ